MGFRELEWQIAGRIKSVLILILSALLVLYYADTTRDKLPENNLGENTASGTRTEIPIFSASGQAVVNDNPIDCFFLEVEEDIPESMRKSWQILYLDAWEQELAHAYELMEGELPGNFFWEDGYGQRAMQAFDVFSEAQAYLEDYYVNDILSSGEQESSLTINMIGVRLELIRAQTLRLYEEIGNRGTMTLRLREDGQLEKRLVDVEELYLFSESEAAQMLELIYR